MRKSKLSWYKQSRLIELFIAANNDNTGLCSGEIEVDERYFGGKRKGKRDRAATGKIPV